MSDFRFQIMENEKGRILAEQIVELLQKNQKESDDSFLRSSIEKINQRLDGIESQIKHTTPRIQSPTFHPSQEKFAVAEAVGQEISEQIGKEKACIFEPNGKPCDHCSMCNSRGF